MKHLKAVDPKAKKAKNLTPAQFKREATAKAEAAGKVNGESIAAGIASENPAKIQRQSKVFGPQERPTASMALLPMLLLPHQLN